MKIVLVEDDYLEEELVRQVLRERFRIQYEDIRTISTECEFHQEARKIATSPTPPQLVIIDVMMRWTNPAPDMPAPPDQVRKEGATRAGLRCAELLDALNPAIPILFYSILDRSDLDTDLLDRRGLGKLSNAPQNGGLVDYARKDEHQDELVDKLRQVLTSPGDSAVDRRPMIL
jgi:CheY-like chemotaxis protein